LSFAARTVCLTLTLALTTLAAGPARGGLPLAPSPESVGLLAEVLAGIDHAVADAIAARELAGAVVLVARRGSIGYLKAFGERAGAPRPEPMTTDTIFDMASLTKVMATAPSILLLVERGKIRLDDRVKRYLSEFTGGGKDAVTVRQLLTHYSGLRPDFDLSVPWEGYGAALAELWKETARQEPGKEFVYSDLNFIALGEVVQRVSGRPLDGFARENLYQPLGMTETAFRPPAEWRPRVAPTESRARSLEYLKGNAPPGLSQEVLRGSVHDPTAWRMGGVAGHAGLFSSARDVAIYAQMLLNRGTYAGRRVLSPSGVAAMTRPQNPRSGSAQRGLGWDLDSPHSVPRGDLFAGGFGHTGFTGTSLWVHPASETFLLILSSRLYPNGQGDVTHLRGVIADVVAAALADPQ
jgi:CubicO group peptidase (beta-lactamase class C family)